MINSIIISILIAIIVLNIIFSIKNRKDKNRTCIKCGYKLYNDEFICPHCLTTNSIEHNKEK